MRTWLRGFAVVAAAGLMASVTQSAFAQTRAENQLVGVRLWKTYREVLAKYGQPTRIENGPVTGPQSGGAAGGDTVGGGMMGGGLPSMGGMGMSSGSGVLPNPYGGGSGGGSGRGGKMGMMMGGAGMGGPPSLPGGEGDPGLPGGRGGMGRGGMMPNSIGGGGGSGMSGFGMAGGGGMMGGGMGGGGGSTAGEGEVTWIYERPGQLTYMFLFNKDGRVIQIQEFGYKGGQPTSRGVGLGDPANKVYAVYGWAGSAVKNGNQLTLDYSQKHHIAFQLLSSAKGAKVIGITLAITELGQGSE